MLCRETPQRTGRAQGQGGCILCLVLSSPEGHFFPLGQIPLEIRPRLTVLKVSPRDRPASPGAHTLIFLEVQNCTRVTVSAARRAIKIAGDSERPVIFFHPFTL